MIHPSLPPSQYGDPWSSRLAKPPNSLALSAVVASFPLPTTICRTRVADELLGTPVFAVALCASDRLAGGVGGGPRRQGLQATV